METRYEALLDLIYGAVADPHNWPEVLTRISDHLGAVGGLLVYIAPPGRGRSLEIVGRLSEELSAFYLRHYSWNPWTLAMTKVPFGKAVAVNSLLERGTISKTAFYADVLEPQGIVEALNITHRAMTQDGSIGGLGFSLSARGADRADESVRRLQRLSPHLCRAVDATLKLGHLADGTRQLASVLQLMPNPRCCSTARGASPWPISAAEALLRSGDGLALDRDGGLRAWRGIADGNRRFVACLGAGAGSRIRNGH